MTTTFRRCWPLSAAVAALGANPIQALSACGAASASSSRRRSVSGTSGDGTTGDGQTISHTCGSAGTYNLTLTMANSHGQQTCSTATPCRSPWRLRRSGCPVDLRHPGGGEHAHRRRRQLDGAPSSVAYHWEDCDSSGGNCVGIAGVSGPSYTVSAADVSLRVLETASDGGGASDPAASAPTAVVAMPAPTSLSPPTISGDLTQGQTLTRVTARSNAPSTYAYQWQRCDSAGGGCAAEPAAEARERLSPRHQRRRADRPDAPGSSGRLYGSAPIAFAYQWQRCSPGCTDIAGATASSYRPGDADRGGKLRVLVTASNSAGAAQAASQQVGPVAGQAPAPGSYGP